ncbi:hypothetical protein WA158_004925 [Blastocystis sp. Blastoise]
MSISANFNAHAEPVYDCLEILHSDAKNGLSTNEAQKRLRDYGYNELGHEESTPLWKLVLAQFDDFLVKILLVSALLSFILAFFENSKESGITAFVEPFVILLILIINAVIGVWQEGNAENALKALKEMQSEKIECLRDGTYIRDFPARELVPGDIIKIRIGDKVPADCRIIKLKTTTLRAEESALTGEAKTILKYLISYLFYLLLFYYIRFCLLKEADMTCASDCGISEKINMLFSGTSITNGIAICVVVHTGMETEIGKIQQAVMDASEEEQKTPLSIKIDEFGEFLGKVIMVICVLVWVINFNQFSDPIHGSFIKGCIYYLKIAVALGVAAIPEGLPAVITLCLSLGTRRMVEKNCIVRKLPSVETLGCTTVICSDKTGTLTTNEMTVVCTYTMNANGKGTKRIITGVSYKPDGFVENIEDLEDGKLAMNHLEEVCSLCNSSSVEFDKKKNKYVCVGEPTEAALKILVEKMGVPDKEIQKSNRHNASIDSSLASHITNDYFNSLYTTLATLEFTRSRKSMSVIAKRKNSNDSNILFVKGAPENIIARCTSICLDNGTVVPLTPSLQSACESCVYSMSKESLRVLAMAGKTDLGDLSNYNGPSHPHHKDLLDFNQYEQIESGLTLYGFCGIKDPARPEVLPAIRNCQTAGIRVFMITGDNKVTAEAIAREVGIFEKDEDISNKSFDARQFMKLPLSQQKQLVGGCGGRVFSRTEPVHKKQLISLLREMGEITAMTGDGVNDAPALKQADIGVAMGISGTEVAKEASDMILTDDNFATIVSAIEQGRAIYQNMKAFIRYLISSNIGEVASIFFTSLLGIPENLSPVQLLWVNLVTDGLPATALGFNPPDPALMKLPPRDKDEGLITPWVFFRYMIIGLYVGFATIGIFVYWYIFDVAEDNHPLVLWSQLSKFHTCSAWEGFTVADYTGKNFESACDYFTVGSTKASTLSLTVLVTIEMFNALNALSETCSLLTVPPHKNIYLVLAILASFVAHFIIVYFPIFETIFGITSLTLHDLWLVFIFSFPVILIDEFLKLYSRLFMTPVNKKETVKEEAQPLLSSTKQWDLENKFL